MKNKLDTGFFNCTPFEATHIEKFLKSSYDKIERCESSPWAPYKCFKGNNIFVVNPNGTLLSKEPFVSFDIYGKNFFVGKQELGITDYSNSIKFKYIIFDFQSNVLCSTNIEPKYLGWRIIACNSEHDGIRLFNPYGEIKCNYNIRDIRKFGEYNAENIKFGKQGTYSGTHNVNFFFSIFEITDSSTSKVLYGLLNIYGEVSLEPKYDIIEFDFDGNIKASEQDKTYNWKLHSIYFDKFLHTTPDFLLQYKSFHALSKSLYAVSNDDDKVGVVNCQNISIIPFEFKSIYGLNNGLAVFRKDNECGVIRLCDKKIITSSPQDDFEICNGEVICRSNGKYVIYCNNTNVQIEWYDKIEHIFNHYFKVKRDNKYGITNSNGEKLINVDYERIIISDEFVFLIKAYGYSYEGITGGYYSNDIIDSNDIIHPIFGNEITILSKDFTPLTNYNFNIERIERTEISTYIIKSSNGYGVLDSNFNIIIPPIFKYMCYSEYEYTSEKGRHSMDGRFIFEDDKTIKVIDLKYSYCEPINEKYFICLNKPNDIYNYQDYKFGVLDSNFNEIIPNNYQHIEPTFQDDLFLVRSFNNKWGVINANNKIIISTTFDSIFPIKESNSFIVSSNYNNIKSYGLYNLDGTKILNCQYRFIGKESSGYRTIFKDNTWGLVNTSNGVIIFFPDAAYVGVVKDNILRINIGGKLIWNKNTLNISKGKWGYIDILGNKIIPCMYDQAETITNNFAIVKKGNNWGIVKLDNTELIPFEYKSINIFDKKIHCYINEYEYYIFNLKGEKIGNGEDFPDENYYDEPYDPDPWGANAELDYIRNNGGDWIDD